MSQVRECVARFYPYLKMPSRGGVEAAKAWSILAPLSVAIISNRSVHSTDDAWG